MSKLFKKVFLLFFFAISIVSSSGCGLFDSLGEAVAEGVVGEFDTDKNDSEPTGDNANINEDILYETVLLEDVLNENKINETKLEERIAEEILYDENLIAEDITIESLNVDVYSDVDEMEEDFCCESYYSIDLDYALIKQRIAKGASLVLAEIVIDAVSCVIDIVSTNWGELAIDAGQIIITAGGTSLSAFVASQVAKAKSLAAGNSYEIAMYDALYEGSKAFYYTSVVIDKVNTIVSLFQLIDTAVKGVKSLVAFIDSKASGDILDSTGKIIGKSSNGTYDVTIDGVQHTCKASQAPGLTGNSIDLYDTTTKTYVTTIKKSGDAVIATKRTIPNEILLKAGDNVGKAKYIFEGTDAYKITYENSGNPIKTFIGKIDPSGYITNNYGQIIKKIDFDTGKELNGFTNLIKASKENKITVDVLGEIVEISGDTTKPLVKKTIDGTVTYLDSMNNVILREYKGADGITYLMRASDDINVSKVCGAIADNKYSFGWNNSLNYIRSNATSTIRKHLVEYVKNNNINIVRQNFPELTIEQIKYIREYGRIPTSIQIHHCKNVANFPDFAGDLSNLVVLNRQTHLAAHGGNFHNASFGKPYCYINLAWLFGL